jgi:signal transduction histidine kinase
MSTLFVVEGRDRPLQPFIRDEIYRIAREAVVNAFRHSAASRVELSAEHQNAVQLIAPRRRA